MPVNKRDFLYNTAQETISASDLKALQLKKLQRSVGFVAARSAFYKRAKGIAPAAARFASLEDFSRTIPLTTKQDLIGCDLYENLCVPKEDIAEVHCSSGTSNKPVCSFLTRKDLQESSAYLARTWHMQGVRKDSVFTMFASYGLFSAGLINHYALQRIGAFVVPAGNASASKTFAMLEAFAADSCAAVASYYLYLIAMAEAGDIDLKELKLTHLIAGGEPFSEKQRTFIEKAFGASLFDQYGLCEINTGLAGECSEKNGLHILADYAYPEIIDPETEKPLQDGQEGELVLTTFHKEASPLVRYRTGDITSITHAPCRCGRTMPRIARVKRRVTDTLFYKGMKIEKPYIAGVLEDLSHLLNPYVWQMEINTASGKEELLLRIAPISADGKAMDHVTGHMHQKLGVKVRVELFKEEELSQLGSGKLKHFIDNRET